MRPVSIQNFVLDDMMKWPVHLAWLPSVHEALKWRSTLKAKILGPMAGPKRPDHNTLSPMNMVDFDGGVGN